MQHWMRLVFAMLALAAAWQASAEVYPERPIRLIVPYAPGGNLDITARIIAPHLTEALGQPIVVENYGGAGGTIGIDRVVKSAPDGYALALGATGPITLAPILYPKNPYDTLTDLTPVGFVSNVPSVLLVHPALPAKNVQDYIALAKARPGQLTLGGAGTSRACDLFQYQTGIKIVLIRYYKGSGPGLIDLMGGHIDSMFDQMSSAAVHIKSGKLRALAVGTSKRATLFPDIPTLAESGVKDAETITYSGVFGPAGLPRDIVEQAQRRAEQSARTGADERKRFAAIGAEVWASTPAEFATFIREDIAKWRRLAKQLDMRLE